MRVLTFLLPLLVVTPTLAADRALLLEAEQSYAHGPQQAAPKPVRR
jgi:hypothetical protein